ncbi:class I SAM-dependent methyltransferase [Streptomyces sp. C11-1]|uniref:Class I SAM-dependent methyltransferase n=1 Tax=Streptomyces durocortorensis TaxID=2811104 RepID=A0ABY9W5Z2_9ACTN|nr:class I SAM-dependent methyltransferase [Streptomyces durocortorensis]WNF30486.1 class I SAM-dependent methyltransferase [Streptomyces durocortorensis]
MNSNAGHGHHEAPAPTATAVHPHSHAHAHAHAHTPAHGSGSGADPGTDIDWDVMGPLLEQDAELSSTQYEEAARWIAALPTAPQVRRVLDIGSGPGVVSCLLADVFPEAEVVAVDATPALLERARNRARRLGVIERFDTREAELPRDVDRLGQADLVWAGNSLHHMGDQRAALASFAGLLTPGGTVALVEGGLPTRRLPRDIGIGRPGLEARMEAAAAERFDRMRAELPDTKRETEDWSALLAAVGLAPQGTRSFLLDLPAPLSRAARDHAVASMAREREVFGELLTAEDDAVLERLLDPDDPQGLHHRPDVYLLTARTVHLGRREA